MTHYRCSSICLFVFLLTACGSPSGVLATQAVTAELSPTATELPASTLMPTTTPAPTTSPISESIKFNVLILGCNTGVDVAHGMGEVTNIYVQIQNVGTAEANDVQVIASATDEDRPHPDKLHAVPHLPPGNEITFKFTVDTQFRKDTTITIDLSSDEGAQASSSRTDCRQLDRGDLSLIELAILQGVRSIAK